jgi:NAD(P)-dependent dehydrogenase (short-subunit alcohol dehydrogenase family)
MLRTKPPLGISAISGDEEWRLTFEVNIHAMFYLAKGSGNTMKPGSAIINTASVNAEMPNPILLAYETTQRAGRGGEELRQAGADAASGQTCNR